MLVLNRETSLDKYYYISYYIDYTRKHSGAFGASFFARPLRGRRRASPAKIYTWLAALAVLFDKRGSLRSLHLRKSSCKSYTLNRMPPSMSFGLSKWAAEAGSEVIWSRICEVVREMLRLKAEEAVA